MDLETIQKKRQAIALPILQNLEIFMQEQCEKALPKSRIGKALYYSLVQWKKLAAYTEEWFLQIGINLIENAIRPIAIGGKITSLKELFNEHQQVILNVSKRRERKPLNGFINVVLRMGSAPVDKNF